MVAKIIKLQVSAHIIFEEGDTVQGETFTKPIDIYRGQEITNELLTILERLALQNFIDQRPTESG
jgi:hypothetical protein